MRIHTKFVAHTPFFGGLTHIHNSTSHCPSAKVVSQWSTSKLGAKNITKSDNGSGAQFNWGTLSDNDETIGNEQDAALNSPADYDEDVVSAETVVAQLVAEVQVKKSWSTERQHLFGDEKVLTTLVDQPDHMPFTAPHSNTPSFSFFLPPSADIFPTVSLGVSLLVAALSFFFFALVLDLELLKPSI